MPIIINRRDISLSFMIVTVEIPCFDRAVIDEIDSSIVSICEGCSDSDVNDVKLDLMNFFETQSKKTVVGAVAEFFIHLVVRKMGFKQEFLFRNLEENSIKKGFDGVYSGDEQTWLMESKAGGNANCVMKASKAYADLKDKLEGKAKNNPWRNAFNHASHIDVGADESIRSAIKKLANDYRSKKFHKIESFNIMPCGTSFGDANVKRKNKMGKHKDTFSYVVNMMSNKKDSFCGKRNMIICIESRIFDEFLKYIKGEMYEVEE